MEADQGYLFKSGGKTTDAGLVCLKSMTFFTTEPSALINYEKKKKKKAQWYFDFSSQQSKYEEKKRIFFFIWPLPGIEPRPPA